MIVPNATGDRLEGIYRGIVLKHLPHGKCKIFIPGVYSREFYEDPDLLPTAQQRACLFAGTNEGNGVFTYPNLSTIVWCQFLNGDVNFPVYDSVTLGGEDAFGQYELIKKKNEPVSERHMITSGKTHMLWYEKGILSGIVEDPIRTQCSVDYDRFEIESNNTSALNKYSYTLSNRLQEMVDKNEISNINCQYVFNNDAETHGELSVSSHWYDILSTYLSDEQYLKKGTISTDSYLKINNDGLTKFDTLSTYSVNETFGKEGKTVSDYSQTHNLQAFTVDNKYDNEIRQEKQKITSQASGSIKRVNTLTFCNEHHGNDADYLLNTRSELTSIGGDAIKKTSENILDTVENIHEMRSSGSQALYSVIDFTGISADQNKSSMYSKILDVKSTYENDASTGLMTMSMLSTLRLNTVNDPITQTVTSQLTNIVEADGNGDMHLMVKNDFIQMSDSLKKSINSSDTVKGSISGSHSQVLKYKKGQGASSITDNVVDNTLNILEKASDDLSYELQMTSVKSATGTPYIDGLYDHQINSSQCKSSLKFIDNMVNQEHGNNIDVKAGKHEIFITNKSTGSKCTITMKTDGTFEMKTTTSVTVVTPAVLIQGSSNITLQSPSIVLDGPTQCTNVLTVDKDTITNNISFVGHMHTGNLGAPTSPPLK